MVVVRKSCAVVRRVCKYDFTLCVECHAKKPFFMVHSIEIIAEENLFICCIIYSSCRRNGNVLLFQQKISSDLQKTNKNIFISDCNRDTTIPSITLSTQTYITFGTANRHSEFADFPRKFPSCGCIWLHIRTHRIRPS